jgi:hypothetical protein
MSSDATDTLRAVMRALEDLLPGCAITLLIAPFDAKEGARTNYISNGRRADMLVALKEVIARFEGRALDLTETKQ